MAGVGVPLTVVVTYAGAENAALTAALTLALGTPASNADVGGTWTTAWASINFSIADRGEQSLRELARVIGVKPAGVTFTITG